MTEAGIVEARVVLGERLASNAGQVEFKKVLPLMELDRSQWKIIHCDSAEDPGEGPASNAIDGDPSTLLAYPTGLRRRSAILMKSRSILVGRWRWPALRSCLVRAMRTAGFGNTNCM